MRFLTAFWAVLFFATPGFAQLGVIVAGKVGSDLITEARQTAASLIGQAEASGNALILRNANELNVLAANAALLLGDEMTKTIDEMSIENRALMNALALGIKTAQDTVSSATYSLRDAVALDLRGVIASTGLGEQFHVQRITGLTQLYRDSGEYRISITGIGLGIPTEKRRSTVRLLIDGKIPSRVTTTTPDAYTTVFSIPNAVLASRFPRKKMGVTRVTIDISYDFKSGVIFPRWHNLKHRVVLRLALMPAYAGTISVDATSDVLEWVKLRSEVAKRTTGNHHCERNCRDEPTRTNYTLTIKVPSTGRGVPGDQKLLNPNVRCVPQMVDLGNVLGVNIGPRDVSSCAWSTINSVYLSEADTRASASFDVWSKPMNWELTADVYEYQVAREEHTTKTYDLYFGRLVEIEVPKTTTSAKISGKLVTNNTFELVAGNNDAQNFLKLEREISANLNRKYIYLVNRPAID